MFAFRNEAVKAWGELPRNISNALTVSSWTYVHTRTHNDKQHLPPTHVYTYTHLYLHTDTTLPSINTYYTHLHHIHPPMPHRYICNVARTHTPGTHLRTHVLIYTHTHTYTYCQKLYLHICTNTHMYPYTHIHKKTAYTVENPVFLSRWGEGLVLAREATCSRPIHPQ